MPDNYRLWADSLAWLMNEWRAKALVAASTVQPAPAAPRPQRTHAKSLIDQV